MSWTTYNYLAVAVAGQSAAIRQFAEQVKTANIVDESEMLNHFRIVDIDLRYKPDFALFIYRAGDGLWKEEEKITWQAICKLAVAAHLSWIFYHVGKNSAEIELRQHLAYPEDGDSTFLDLFTIRRNSATMPYS
jgi:hypothetical protein